MAHTPKLTVEEIIEKIDVIDIGDDLFFLETELEITDLDDNLCCRKSRHVCIPWNGVGEEKNGVVEISGYETKLFQPFKVEGRVFILRFTRGNVSLVMKNYTSQRGNI